MSIFEVLGRQQREIEELFGDIKNAVSTNQRELAYVTFQLLSMKLIAAMRAEHAVVYPRFERDAKLIDEVAQARREHDAIEQLITRIRVTGLRKDAWAREVAALAKLVAQHAELEEYTLFPLAALAIPMAELSKIGVEYKACHTMATSVAGPSITYEPAQFEPPPAVIVRFKAA
jgi:hypothetical protein